MVEEGDCQISQLIQRILQRGGNIVRTLAPPSQKDKAAIDTVEIATKNGKDNNAELRLKTEKIDLNLSKSFCDNIFWNDLRVTINVKVQETNDECEQNMFARLCPNTCKKRHTLNLMGVYRPDESQQPKQFPPYWNAGQFLFGNPRAVLPILAEAQALAYIAAAGF